jgi:hypothetical protein
MDVNPMGKKWSKFAFFSIFSTIQRSSFIIFPQYESQQLDAGWLWCFARSCQVKKKPTSRRYPPATFTPPPPSPPRHLHPPPPSWLICF